MPNHIVVIRDVRLKGFRPKGDSVLEVNFDTPITWPISWAVERAKEFGDDHWMFLKIMGHGYACADGAEGGCGIEFCEEKIKLHTLHYFQPLCQVEDGRKYPYYHGIDLLACGAAFITPGAEGENGDGNFLCYQMAQITQSNVRASTAKQKYKKGSNEKPHLDFGNWEGTVYTYGPAGNVVKIEQAPGRDTLPWGA